MRLSRAALPFAALALSVVLPCIGATVGATSALASPATGNLNSHALTGNVATTAVSLGDLGGGSSTPGAINSQGQVVGSSYVGGTYAFSWTAAGGMVNLGTPFGTLQSLASSSAVDVNDSGEAVGNTSLSSPAPPAAYGFTWTAAGGMNLLLGLHHGDTPNVVAVNNQGQVIGNNVPSSGVTHAVFWSAGNVITDLGSLTATGGSQATAINNNGEVVGSASTALADDAFAWTSAGGMVDLGHLGPGSSSATAVNDAGQVVGYGYTGHFSDVHAFSWTPAGGMVDLGTLGGPNSQPFAINSHGQVVGWTTTAGGIQAAFSWTAAGGMVDLGNLGGAGGSQAMAINNNGVVVGRSETATGDWDAFSWTAAGGMVDLGNLAGDWGKALAVNDAGQVIGVSYPANTLGPNEATMWTVPSPAGGTGGTGGPTGGSGGGGSVGGSGSGAGAGAASTSAAAIGVSRLAGSDRISTAVAVSHTSFPTGGAGAVVLARADDYPDALVGAPLAAAKNAPLLLTDGSTLAAATSTEIARALTAGGTVYILGGVGAIPAAVATQLTGAGYHVVRYAGADRFATAVAVAGALANPGTVLLASGENYPDALAAGPAAAHVHGAVLLTDGNVMPAATKSYLAKTTTVYAIGGPAATADPAATAVFGADRYETAAAVATKFFTAPAVAGIATGLSFPDALSGGAQLALLGGPLLLASQGSVPFATADYIGQTRTITDVRVYGGTAVLGDSVVTQLQSIEDSV
jgi:probable HAF family extracellular repeat protein